MRIHVVVLFAVLATLLAGEVSANSASQSDWSGGTVPPGPVLTWGEEFCESMWMNWMEPGELSIGSDTLFFDSFDRFCPSNWGTPDIGGTYTYEYPDNADWSITENVGFIDDNSAVHDPKAISILTESADTYVLSFSWKYTTGHSSWLTLNNGAQVVVGVRQEEVSGKLCFLVDGSLYQIENRQGGVWKDYSVVVDDMTAKLYIDGQLKYTAFCSQNTADNIRFVTNGNGTPSDNWFEDVAVCSCHDEAYLTSSILDVYQADGSVEWYSLSWICTEPAGTNVSMQVRASDDAEDMGGWSEELEVSGIPLGDYCDSTDRYFQYRVLMDAENVAVSPVFEEVSIGWEYSVSIEEQGWSDGTLFSVSNPSGSDALVDFSIPGDGHVSIDLFDISGRMVDQILDEDMTAGDYSMQINNLSSGTYLCRMEAPGYHDCRRFVVLQD